LTGNPKPQLPQERQKARAHKNVKDLLADDNNNNNNKISYFGRLSSDCSAGDDTFCSFALLSFLGSWLAKYDHVFCLPNTGPLFLLLLLLILLLLIYGLLFLLSLSVQTRLLKML
jgi:hypothetical protein